MMDQQNLGTIRPASADPAAVALAKALGQWPKPAGSTRPSPKKAFDSAPAATVEALAKELGLRLGGPHELTLSPPPPPIPAPPAPPAGSTPWRCRRPIARCATRPIRARISRRSDAMRRAGC